MNFDISTLLNEWEYKPGQIAVRRFKGKDGVEKIQLRIDLGLLQMNSEGRPDGKRPFGHESLLEHYESKLVKHMEENEGNDAGFQLEAEDCSKLQQESIQYHHRYICLFQLEDYEAVIRDAERNLRVFDFVERYAASEEIAWSLQQFRPQLVMILARSRASLALDDDHYSDAMDAVSMAMEEIQQFYRRQSRPDLIEQSGEIQSLEILLKELQENRPLSEKEKLENALAEAVRREDYEKAAQVRDTLRNLKSSQ